jgi:hypothetical protein
MFVLFEMVDWTMNELNALKYNCTTRLRRVKLTFFCWGFE